MKKYNPFVDTQDARMYNLYNYIRGQSKAAGKWQMPTEGVILSGIFGRRICVFFIRENRTVVGWRAGEARETGAEGESGKPRISQAKGQR